MCVDVIVCVCQTYIKKQLTYLLGVEVGHSSAVVESDVTFIIQNK